MRVDVLGLACLLLVAAAAPVLAAAEAGTVEEADILSDAQIEKMRVKQLKVWLREHGVPCAGCVEKSHLVAAVKANRSAPKVAVPPPAPKPESKSRTASTKKKASSATDSSGSFGDAWGRIGRKACAGARGSDEQCAAFGQSVSSVFGAYATNLFKALGKSEAQMKVISLGFPYKDAGEAALRKSVQWMLKEAAPPSKEDVEKQVRMDCAQWMLNTAMEKKESMMGGNMDIEELMRKYKTTGGFGGGPPPPPRHEDKRMERRAKRQKKKKEEEEDDDDAEVVSLDDAPKDEL